MLSHMYKKLCKGKLLVTKKRLRTEFKERSVVMSWLVSIVIAQKSGEGGKGGRGVDAKGWMG